MGNNNWRGIGFEKEKMYTENSIANKIPISRWFSTQIYVFSKDARRDPISRVVDSQRENLTD